MLKDLLAIRCWKLAYRTGGSIVNSNKRLYWVTVMNSSEEPIKDVERFQKAMKAWLRVAGFLHEHIYVYDMGTIICWYCKEGGIYNGGDTFPVTHAEDCKAKQAEAALETLRKMATGVI